MASTVSTEQLGVLGRRMRTVAAVTRRLGPLPLADELPRAFEQHATPAAALLAAADEVQPTRVPRAGITGLSRCLLPPLPALRALVVEPIKHPRQRPAEPSPRPRRRGERDR